MARLVMGRLQCVYMGITEAHERSWSFIRTAKVWLSPTTVKWWSLGWRWNWQICMLEKVFIMIKNEKELIWRMCLNISEWQHWWQWKGLRRSVRYQIEDGSRTLKISDKGESVRFMVWQDEIGKMELWKSYWLREFHGRKFLLTAKEKLVIKVLARWHWRGGWWWQWHSSWHMCHSIMFMMLMLLECCS